MGQQLNVITGQSKQEEAIDFIRQHEPPEGYFLGFSGGKDSTVLKHLAELSGVKFRSCYSATGIDAPELVSHIKRNFKDVKFFRPQMSFYDFILKKGFPLRQARWCCIALKEKPVNHLIGSWLLGLRAEEGKRGKRQRIEKRGKNTQYKPIFRWTEYDIWDHIDRYHLPYCKLYDDGFDRLGCVICPMHCRKNQTQINIRKQRWPGIYRAFERAMENLYEDREWFRQKAQGRAMLFEEFLDNWYKGK